MPRFNADTLWRILRDDFALAAGAKLAVAYSGGRDSTALLHALAAARQAHDFALTALHFDHGLAAESADWAAHCAAVCRELAVDFAAEKQAIAKPPGASLEAHARRCRYAWFARAVAPGGVLLTAHHADDQAETVLLNLLRGGGPESLAGIAPRRALSAEKSTQVARPLLAFSADALADYAQRHGLNWVDDPANAAQEFDRNYLRASALPALKQRWPGAADSLGKAAAHSRAAADLLAAADAQCFESCRMDAKRGVFCLAPPLEVARMRSLGRARVERLARHWLHRHGCRSPSAGQLAELFAQVFESQSGGGMIRWDGVEARHFAGRLYLIPQLAEAPAAPVDWDLQPRDLGVNGLRVAMENVTVGDVGLDPNYLRGKRVQLVWRRGGERMVLPGRAHGSALKKLFQQCEAPPWERRALPLLSVDGEIAWAPAIGPAAAFACAAGEAGLHPRFTVAPDADHHQLQFGIDETRGDGDGRQDL